VPTRRDQPSSPEKPTPGATGPRMTESQTTTPGTTAPAGDGLPPGVTGPELARAVVDAAKAKRAAAPRPQRPAATGRGRRARGYSGPGPDPRDPQLFGSVLSKIVKNRGWSKPAAEATVFAAWERVAGADVAAHCRPVKLEEGELTIEAESTAWAMQLRLLATRLLKQISAEVGPNVVRRLHIHGPSAPNWSRGPRRVPGRGPRDTYG